MSGYLLDTGPCAAVLFQRPAIVQLVTPWLLRREVSTSLVVEGEIVEQIRGSPRFVEQYGLLQALLRSVPAHGLSHDTMLRYADIRRALRPPYGPGLIGDIDALIAATVLEHDLTVVTADQHFQRVPGLNVMLLARQQLTR